MSIGLSVLLIVIAFSVSFVATGQLTPLLRRVSLVDVPNGRSLHTRHTPRGGGIGVLLGLTIGLVTAYLHSAHTPAVSVLLGATIVASLGFVDDCWGLPVTARLAVQAIAAGIAVSGTGGISRFPFPAPLDVPLGSLAIPVAIVWVVGATNIYNFLDGIDGFAGAQGVVAGLSVAAMEPGSVFAPLGLIIAGSCGGFLLFNWRPARVFMGDVGAYALGFLFAVIPLQASLDRRSSAVFLTAMFLWFFLADGAFTIVRRLLRGEKVWQAHRSHLYQRLACTGMSHDQVVIRVELMALSVAAAALLANRLGSPAAMWLAFGGAVSLFIVYWQWICRRERRLTESGRS